MNETWEGVVAACRHGDEKRAGELLAAEPALVAGRDLGDWTLLHHAASQNSVNVVSLLVKLGADVEARDRYGWAPLRWAVILDHLPAARELLRAGTRLQTADRDGLLCLAAKAGDPEIVGLVLRCYAAPILQNHLNKALECAMTGPSVAEAMEEEPRGSRLETLRLLLAAGADPGSVSLTEHGGREELSLEVLQARVAVTDLDGELEWAVAKGYARLFAALLKSGPPLTAEVIDNLLFDAAKGGSTQIIEFLLEAGANVLRIGHESHYPLHWAAREGHPEALRLLLQAGSDEAMHHECELGYTPLAEAFREGQYAVGAAREEDDRRVVKLLIEAGARVRPADQNYFLSMACRCWFVDPGIVRWILDQGDSSPDSKVLAKAAWIGDPAIVAMLIEAGADVNGVGGDYDDDDDPVLSFARTSEVADMLLAAGAKVDLPGDQSPLANACRRMECDNSVGVVRALLRAGANPHAVDAEDGTILEAAMASGCAEKVGLILAAGVQIGPGNRNRLLRSATAGGNAELVRSLLKLGADLSDSDKHGGTALHCAVDCTEEYAEVVRLLLLHGAKPDTLIRDETPLTLACEKGNVEVVHWLLAAGATVCPGADGRNPLCVGGDRGRHHRVIEILLAGGADPNARYKDEHTPLQAALKRHKWEVANTLCAAGARLDG